MVLCQCRCGKNTTIRVDAYISARTTSCGCLSTKKGNNTKKYTHYLPHLHSVYLGMIRRCYNPKCISFYNYGGRGVRVCKTWRNNYQNFLNWALVNGYKRGLHLDKDKLGTGKLYSPLTCCFITAAENMKYKRFWYRHSFYFKGKKRPISEICAILGLSYPHLYRQLVINAKSISSIKQQNHEL